MKAKVIALNVNHFVITVKGNDPAIASIIFFQGYNTIIVKIVTFRQKPSQLLLPRQQTFLDKDKWGCNTTTSRYRNQFLGETIKMTKAKIASGKYILADLN